MPLSPLIKVKYPDVNKDNWNSDFVSMVNGFDSVLYSAREDRNIIITGGGTVSFTIAGPTGTLTWSSGINILSSITGFSCVIPAGSIDLADFEIFYVNVTRSPLSTSTMTIYKASSLNQSTAPNDVFLVGYRSGTLVYFHNGKIINNGESGLVFSITTLAGSGGSTLQAAYEAGNTIVTSAPEGTFSLTGTEAITLTAGATSTWQTTSGSLTIDANTALNLGNTTATSVAIGSSGITTTITGGLAQTTGEVSILANGAGVSITTSAGPLTLDAIGAVSIGVKDADSIDLGYDGITTTITGNLTQLTGEVSILANGAGVSITTSAGPLTLDAIGAVSIGVKDADSITLGYDGITTTIDSDLDLSLNLNFSEEDNHNISIISSTTPGVSGGVLTFFGADGAPGDASNAGATGGDTFIEAGFGGDASAAHPAGTGGTIQLFGGFGGSGSATQLGGNGGNVSGVAGNAGVDGGFGTGNGGSYIIDAGSGTLNGNVAIGTSVAAAVNVGRSGITTTVTGGLTQLTGAFSITGNATSSIGTNSGLLNIDTNGTALRVGGTSAGGVFIGHTGIITTVNGDLTQQSGAVSLTGNAASSLTTSTGALTLDAATALNLGNTNATSIAMGRSGITSTITGGLTQLTGAVSLTGNAASQFSTSSGALTLTAAAASVWKTSGGALTVDAAAALNLGSTDATSIALGKSGITTTITGGLTQLTGAVSLTGNAASQFSTSSGALTLDAATALNLGNTTATSVAIGRSGIVSTVTGNLALNNRLLEKQGADVASANNLVLGSDGNFFVITGTNTINLISNLTWQDGAEITLYFSGSTTLKHNQATSTTNITVLLNGGADILTVLTPVVTLRLCTVGAVQAWRQIEKNTPFPVAGFLPGLPGAAALVFAFQFPTTVIFPAGLTGSYAKATVASTGTKVYDVLKAGVSCGSITFTVSATGTFTMASATTFNAGDELTITAPAVQDATLSDVRFTLAGMR